MKKTALVLGAGGFIGSHLVKRLKSEGYWVRGVDLKYPEFEKTHADDFVITDLRNSKATSRVMYLHPEPFDEVYQLAADMGGAGYLFTGKNDVDVMTNSVRINLNVLERASYFKPGKIFFASSACVYNESYQEGVNSVLLRESYAYPSQPDSEYGWEKLFSERLYQIYAKEGNFKCYIGRFHGIFGPFGTYDGGKEKAPAALCRKVSTAKNGDKVEIWGDGEQTRSFLYIDEAVEAIRRLVSQSKFFGPVNIGSFYEVSINDVVSLLGQISGKDLHRKYIKGPQGVRGRSSDNTLIKAQLGWEPDSSEGALMNGLGRTYRWIKEEEGIID